MARVMNNVGYAGCSPTDFKVVALSLYIADLQRLDELVAQLKAMGHTKASRSGLVRFAIAQIDLEKVPRGVF